MNRPSRRPVGLLLALTVAALAVGAVITKGNLGSTAPHGDVVSIPWPLASQQSPASAARAFPSAESTGVPPGVDLKKRGATTIKKAGTVLDGVHFTGPVTIAASNVVIRRSRITGAGHYGVLVKSGSVRLEDSDIVGFGNGLAFSNWHCLRCDISGQSADGVKLGDNVLLEDSYIHDLLPGPGAHADGVQMQGGIANAVVRHNTIDPSNNRAQLGNAAVFLSPTLGPSSDGPVVIENNLLGGGNYTLYNTDGANGKYFVANIRISGNRFKRNFQYGPAHTNVPFVQFDNAWFDSNAALAL